MTDEERILMLSEEEAEAELRRVWQFGLDAEREGSNA